MYNLQDFQDTIQDYLKKYPNVKEICFAGGKICVTGFTIHKVTGEKQPYSVSHFKTLESIFQYLDCLYKSDIEEISDIKHLSEPRKDIGGFSSMNED